MSDPTPPPGAYDAHAHRQPGAVPTPMPAPAPVPAGAPHAQPAYDPNAYAQQPYIQQPHAPPAHDPNAFPQPGTDPNAHAAAAAWSVGAAPGTETVTVPLGATVVAQIAALLLVLVGLSFPIDRTAWVSATAWAVFAAAAALVQLAPALRGGLGLTPERSWTLGAFATAGLVVFWVLVAAPIAASNEGFFLTLGVACALYGTWRSPGSRW